MNRMISITLYLHNRGYTASVGQMHPSKQGIRRHKYITMDFIYHIKIDKTVTDNLAYIIKLLLINKTSN